MWQRFTEHARRVVYFSQEEAGRLGQNYVSTEHLLLGLIRENDSKSARILDALGVNSEQIRSEIEGQVEHGQRRPGQDMQLTPGAKRVVDLAYKEARRLNHNHIGSEHLLLGLIREGDGLAGQVLAKLGVDLKRTRQEVQRLQDGPPEPGTSSYHFVDVEEDTLVAALTAYLETATGKEQERAERLLAKVKAGQASQMHVQHLKRWEQTGMRRRKMREGAYQLTIALLILVLLWVAGSRAMVRQELGQAREGIADLRQELHALRGQMHSCNDDLERAKLPQRRD